MYNAIKSLYRRKRLTLDGLISAVEHGLITPQQYYGIAGIPFSENV